MDSTLASSTMNGHVHFDRPLSYLVSNLSQEISGWLALSAVADPKALQFTVDGRPLDVAFYPRPDAERGMRRRWVTGWTLHLDRAITLEQSRRTIALEIRYADRWSYIRHFYKSKNLMQEGRNSPLFFMHIPKTAGTALRQFVDYAFSAFPTLAIYGDYPGINVREAIGPRRKFTETRELIYGHFDLGFVRELNYARPKVVTIFRNPLELVRSYLNFNAKPAPGFLDNPLVRHVCGITHEPFGAVTSGHLRQALDIAEQHLYILQHEHLQEFADAVTDAFVMPRFTIPHINQNRSAAAGIAQADLPFDLRYDTQLYEACCRSPTSFLDFLNA